MRSRVRQVAGGAALAVGLAAFVPVTLAGQGRQEPAEGAHGSPGAQAAPRTPWGHPDLQGLWNAATMTPVERSEKFAGRLTMTDKEARALEEAAKARVDRLAQPSDGSRQAPPVGGDGSTGAAGNVGGYNYFWIDAGDSYNRVDGQLRTSLVVDPPDGRVPPTLPEALERNAVARRATPTSDAPENAETRAPGAYDNVEQRPLGERCIIGFGSTSGPPMLPTYFYNNMKQIVQTSDHVMILTEMVHDARVIPFKSAHAPPSIRKWLGDSIAGWEGETRVVETTNFTDKTRFRGSSEDLKVTERFNRVDDNTLLYRFTLEDPTTWAQPWTGEYTWALAAPDEHLFEYACHEGNYSLEGILKGARLLEDEEAALKSTTGAR